MFRWIFSQDTEEIAELLVTTIAVFRSELKDKGSEAFQEIGKQKFVREFGKVHREVRDARFILMEN
jgi:hypothetical protein